MTPELIAVRRPPSEDYVSLTSLWSGDSEPESADYLAYLSDLSAAAHVGELDISFPPHCPPTIGTPGQWNLTGDQSFREQFPLSWNFLNPESPNYALKQLQRHLYTDRFEPWLGQLSTGAPVLDAGGGIGRFSVEWLARGHQVTLVDPNSHALNLALGHLSKIGGRFELWQLSAENMSPLADNSFWAVSALEVFCYLSNPLDGFKEAARVLKPGGLMFVSVESAVGSLDLSHKLSPEAISPVLSKTSQAIEDDLWVQYFTQASLRDALESVGLEVEAEFGTHYLPDGPLHRLLDFNRLEDPEYAAAVVQLERLLEGSERWHNTARAWTAVARKPMH